MTPDERQMIADLFERMRSMGQVDKDRDAEGFINQNILTTPDAAYKLVQTVLVQEQALQEMQARVEGMEQQLQAMQQGGGQRAAAGGGFLGGIFGGGRQQAPASVPQTGQRSPGFGQQPAAQSYQPQASSPWGRQAPQQGYQQPMQQQPAPAASGGGFFRGALATAAGVAGGVLAAGAIRDMFGGGSSAQAGKPNASAGGDVSGYDVNAGASGQSDTEYTYQNEEDNDPGNSDGGSWGGDDGSSL
jgi:hypothetical protein